jgi:hypothetical protein
MSGRRLPLLLSVVFLTGSLLAGCTPSYPKAHIADSVQKVVKKEYGLDGKAQLSGDTLYLDVKLSGLTTTNTKDLTEVMQKVQGAVLAVTRVALSSDAKILYLVVSASDPAWKLNMRIVQRLQDVKEFLYQKISRNDYEDRLVLEIDTGEEGDMPLQPQLHRNIELGEFVGRLIVSQFNTLSRNNPFLSVLLDNSKLRYNRIEGEELVLDIAQSVSPKTLPIIEKMLSHEAKKIVKKYDGFSVKRIRIIDRNAQVISVDLSLK